MLLIGCSLIGYKNISYLVMDIQTTLGKNLHVMREKLGWSQEELAERSGIHRTYISGLERGKRNPTLKLIQAIAVSMGIKAAQLLDEQP